MFIGIRKSVVEYCLDVQDVAVSEQRGRSDSGASARSQRLTSIAKVSGKMSHAAWTELDQSRQKLLTRKLGELLTWQAPAIVETVGPFDPAVFAKFGQKCEEIRDLCVAKLVELPEEKIEILLSDGSRDQPIWREWNIFQSNQIDNLRRNIPAWYAGGFGHPDHVADFFYWAKMPRFTVFEIACLSVGVEPNDFTPAKLRETEGSDSTKMPPTVSFLIRQIDLVARQFDPHNFKHKVDPNDFLRWVDRVELEVHPELLRLLRQYHPPDIMPTGRALPSPEPHKREIDMMAQLFTAFAIMELGYVPTQSRSPIPKEIAEMAAKLGLAGTDDTVRKYLKIGTGFLAEGWQDVPVRSVTEQRR